MNIRAKVRCESVTSLPNSTQLVNLRAVHGDCEENRSFSQFTPALETNMTINNPDAIGAFEPGKEYFLDFTPAS